MAFSKYLKINVMSAIPALSHKEILLADRDYEKAASYANLVYVTDQQAGISRMKRGKGFSYLFADCPISDKMELQRIRGLVMDLCTRKWPYPGNGF
jgi:DNA topoisomerase IB